MYYLSLDVWKVNENVVHLNVDLVMNDKMFLDLDVG